MAATISGSDRGRVQRREGEEGARHTPSRRRPVECSHLPRVAAAPRPHRDVLRKRRGSTSAGFARMSWVRGVVCAMRTYRDLGSAPCSEDHLHESMRIYFIYCRSISIYSIYSRHLGSEDQRHLDLRPHVPDPNTPPPAARVSAVRPSRALTPTRCCDASKSSSF